MGNCQAVDAAALVIQHPNGRVERMYWPVTASEVMKMNPGHYVSLIIPLPNNGGENTDDKTIRFTRVKLLRASDTLVLGHAYRLVTDQEVMKVLRAKKQAKMNKLPQPESEEQMQAGLQRQSSSNREEVAESEAGAKNSQAMRHERLRQRSGSTNFAITRSKSWRPSLQSISEAGS